MGNAAKKILTVCIVHEHPMILLGMKKRGFGAGRWNGFGGKLEEGETIFQAALLEMKEEAGVLAKKLERRGVIDFEFQGNSEILEVHFFKSSGIEGEPRESEEMRPQWFHVDEIPFDQMWPSDRYWYPLFLQDKKFSGRVLFGEGESILDVSLTEVTEI